VQEVKKRKRGKRGHIVILMRLQYRKKRSAGIFLYSSLHQPGSEGRRVQREGVTHPHPVWTPEKKKEGRPKKSNNFSFFLRRRDSARRRKEEKKVATRSPRSGEEKEPSERIRCSNFLSQVRRVNSTKRKKKKEKEG